MFFSWFLIFLIRFPHSIYIVHFSQKHLATLKKFTIFQINCKKINVNPYQWPQKTNILEISPSFFLLRKNKFTIFKSLECTFYCKLIKNQQPSLFLITPLFHFHHPFRVFPPRNENKDQANSIINLPHCVAAAALHQHQVTDPANKIHQFRWQTLLPQRIIIKKPDGPQMNNAKRFQVYIEGWGSVFDGVVRATLHDLSATDYLHLLWWL